MAKKKTSKEEQFELTTPGVVTTQDTRRLGRGVKKVQHVESDPEKLQGIIDRQEGQIAELSDALADLEAEVKELRELTEGSDSKED